MNISRRVATVSGFPVQFNKAIVGKNAFAHESGIHQDGMLKNAETFEIMRPTDIGLSATNLVMGKHSGRAALRSKLKELGFDLADNQLNDVFVRFKALADRKKEVYDDDLLALMRDASSEEEHDHLQVKFLRVICGTEAPQSADLMLAVDGVDHQVTATGDGPVDAAFKAVQMVFPHKASAAALSGPRGHRGHRRAGDGLGAAGGGRQDRRRPVGRYRHRGRLVQGLCERPEQADRAAAEDGAGRKTSRRSRYKDVGLRAGRDGGAASSHPGPLPEARERWGRGPLDDASACSGIVRNAMDDGRDLSGKTTKPEAAVSRRSPATPSAKQRPAGRMA